MTTQQTEATTPELSRREISGILDEYQVTRRFIGGRIQADLSWKTGGEFLKVWVDVTEMTAVELYEWLEGEVAAPC